MTNIAIENQKAGSDRNYCACFTQLYHMHTKRAESPQPFFQSPLNPDLPGNNKPLRKLPAHPVRPAYQVSPVFQPCQVHFFLVFHSTDP